MNRPPFALKRLVFQQSDLREIPGIVKRLCRGLDLAATGNPDLLREVFAKLSAYVDMHEFIACLGRGPFPPAGSITRADIQLLFAYKLHVLASIPFMQAWLRAGRARLRGLSIDQFTVERQQEDRLKAIGLKGDQQAAKEAQPTARSWHAEQDRFFKLGAPSYDLCVRPDGRAFNWADFTALYDAIRASRLERSIIDPDEQYPEGSEEAVDNFLSKTVIPQSWLPLSQHIQNGLAVPDHEVVWLFVDSGLCIGRALRHKAHGGVIPRLLLTEEEVAEGLAFVAQGSYLQRGSSQFPNGFVPPRGDDAVYTLKPGVRKPGAVFDTRKETRVATADLERVPNLYAGSLTMVQPYLGTQQVVWVLDGKAVKVRADGALTITYYETTPWLAESDMLTLFPDFRPGPPVDDRNRFAFAHDVQNKVLLPPKALDFQNRASSILERKEQAAHDVLLKLAGSGEFPAICKAELSLGSLDIMAGKVLAEMSATPVGSELILRAEGVSTQITDRFPDLGPYGPLALNAAICIHSNGILLDSADLAKLTLSDLLVALVMLHAGFQKGGRYRLFKPGPSSIVVAQWLAGVTKADGIHDAAAELEGYAAALAAQQNRIDLIRQALIHDADRRREAFNHGYAYVGSELPRAKPRSLVQ